MVEKIYIVWAKLNKNTAKFDLGIFATKAAATQAKTAFDFPKPAIMWVEEYKLFNRSFDNV